MSSADCKVNVGALASSSAVDEPKGQTILSQRLRTNGRLSPVYVSTNWFNLEPLTKYNISVVGDDVEDCASEFVISDLLREVGGSMVTDQFGAGGIRSRASDISLFGQNTAHELYVRLSAEDKTVACCKIFGN